MTLLTIREVSKNFGPKVILEGANLTIKKRDRVGLIGQNGTGKSTLVRILLGQTEPDEGEIQRGRTVTIAAVEQSPSFPPGITVGAAVDQGLRHHAELRARLDRVEAEMAELSGEALEQAIESQADLRDALDRAGGDQVRHLADAMMSALGTPPRDRVLETCSFGEQRRVALVVGLLEAPDLLVLDEPTNHLDLGAIEWLEQYLSAYRGALLLVTHDRYFLDNVVFRIAELERGQLRVYEGNYTGYLIEKAERDEIEAKAAHQRERSIAQELVWVRASAPARTTKQKARLDRFDALVADRPPDRRKDAQFRIPHPPRIGKTLLEIQGLTKALGGRTLIKDLDLILTPRSRVGIVGRNGAGKSTLVRLILGELAPDAGSVILGQNTVPIYGDQARSTLDPSRTIAEEVAGDDDKVWIGDEVMPIQTYLDQLLFDPAAQRMKVGALSGGEKSRVALAKTLRVPGNLMILDEPTNDLDLFTLRVLEEALLDYPGALLLISHDRYFLDRVATSILAFEGDGRVVHYEGSYGDYRRKVDARAAEATTLQKAPPEAPRAPAKPAEAQAKRKRSYKEEQEWLGIEAKILSAEEAARLLEAEIHAPESLKRGAEIPAKLAALEAKKQEIERLYARWAELEAIGKSA